MKDEHYMRVDLPRGMLSFIDRWAELLKELPPVKPDYVIKPEGNSVYAVYNKWVNSAEYKPFEAYVGEEKVSLYLLPETGDSLAKAGEQYDR